MNDELQSRSWHLSKTVPLTLIGGLLLNTFFMGVWSATIAGRVTSQEKLAIVEKERVTTEILSIKTALKSNVIVTTSSNLRLWDSLNTIKVTNSSTIERVAKMEGTIEHIARQVDRIYSKLQSNQK